MRFARLVAVVSLLGALIGVAVLSSPVTAAAAPAGRLSLESGAAPGQPQAVQLSARLAGPDGKPVGSQSIAFFIKSPEFGGIQVAIGSAPTNTAGVAILDYTPRWTGTLSFTAQLPGEAALTAPAATASYLAQTAVPAYQVAPPPLAGLRFGVAWAIEALTAAVWVMLASVLIRVVRRMPRLATAAAEAGEIKGSVHVEASEND